MSRDESARRYNRVLRVTMHNTQGPHGPQRAGIRPPVLKGICCRAGNSPEDVSKSIKAAVQNGDLLKYRDGEGRVRLARTSDAGLRQLIGQQNAADNPDRELIKHCAGLLND